MEKIIVGKKSIEWIATYKRMKSRPYLIPYTKINYQTSTINNPSKWIKDLTIRPETIKLMEENTRGKFLDISLGNDFLGLDNKVKDDKCKNKQVGLH